VFPAWSHKLSVAPRGLALARERGWALAWDADDGLHLFDAAGRPVAQRRMPAGVAAIATADDGGHFAAAGRRGEVWLLTPDLAVGWEGGVGDAATAVALDPLGGYLAAANATGSLYLFDRGGRALWKAQTPRPLRHLVFVPERAVLVGSADFGLVVCLDARGELLWRDGLVAAVGSLAVGGDGSEIVLACYSDGLCRYGVDRPRPERVPVPGGACHLAALSYAGDAVLVAGTDHCLRLLDRAGTVQGQFAAEGQVVGLALDAPGDFAVAALAGGRVLGLSSHGPGGAGPS
jgi:hypothetical protein